MVEIEKILETLDPASQRRGLDLSLSGPRALLAIGAVLLMAAFGAGLAVSHALKVVPAHEAGNSAETPTNLSHEELWALLILEAPGCNLQRSAKALEDPEGRSMALFAGARFNCVDIVADLIARGVDIDEKRFVRGEVISVEDYAAEYGAVDVIRLLLDERARHEEQGKKVTAKQKMEEDLKKTRLVQQRREAEALISQEEELRKSIFYDRARLDCEVLRERMGHSARHLRMYDCIRQGIARRRAEREELGHKVPK